MPLQTEQLGTLSCAFLQVCYLAEELHCRGQKTDCPLYNPLAGSPVLRAEFDAAMDKLILDTIQKYQHPND